MTITLETVTYGDVRFGPQDEPLRDATRKCFTCSNLFDFNQDRNYYTTTYEYTDSVLRWQEKFHYFCDNCTSECGDCGGNRPSDTHSNYYLNNYYHENLCARCSEDYRICDNCSNSYHVDDIRYIGNGDEACCDNCVERVASWCNMCDQYEYNDDLCSPHDDNIHNYGYKPNPIFHGSDDDNQHLRFGIELEVEARNADLSDGSQLMTNGWGEFAYLKEDGSLNFGFEIVTHPASLKYYQQEIDWNVIDKLRNLGFRSWDTSTCGLHVHIDRRAFRDRTHIMAMSMLINNNKDLTEHIVGRNSDYGKIGSSSKRDNIRALKTNSWQRGGYGGDRYLAINLQNASTIELRMFKGSLKIERILSAIEFSHAVVQYSRDIRSGNHASTMLRPEEFTSWIRKQNSYSNLVKFLPEFEITPINNDNEMEE